MLKSFIMENIVFIRIILVIILFLIGNALFISFKSDKIEYRIKKYSVKSIKNEHLSLMDSISKIIETIIKKVSIFFNKIKPFKKYANKYSRYISFSESSNKKEIEYLTSKILFLLIIIIINTIRLLFTKVTISSYLILFLIGYYLPDIFYYYRYRNKIINANSDIVNAINIIANSLKINNNINNALKNAISSLDGQIKDEFEKIYSDITLGINIADAFKRLNNRMNLDLTFYIASKLDNYYKVSNDNTGIFSVLDTNLIEYYNLNNEMNSLMISSKSIFFFALSIPFITTIILLITDSRYFEIVYLNFIGISLIAFIIILYIVYIIIGRKIIKVKL